MRSTNLSEEVKKLDPEYQSPSVASAYSKYYNWTGGRYEDTAETAYQKSIDARDRANQIEKDLERTKTEIATGEREPPGVNTVAAAQRAREIANALGKTKDYVTIGVTETAEGIRIISSSEESVRPGARNALQPGEIAVTGVGHAEITGINAAREMGLNPLGTAASRPICAACARTLSNESIQALSPLK